MSTKSLLFAGVALVAGAAATLPASAAPNLKQAGGQMGPTIMFNLLDRNGDGAIDKDEASALTNAVFAALDTDDSGTLTQQELRGIVNHMRMGHEGMERGPANDRGRPDVRRLPGARGGDDWHGHRRGPGMAERPQLRRWHPGTANAPQAPGPNMGQGPGPNAPQAPGPNMMGEGPGPNAPQGAGPNMMGQGPGPNAGQGGDQTAQADVRTRMFDYLDTNGDGVISKDEFAAARFPHTGFRQGR